MLFCSVHFCSVSVHKGNILRNCVRERDNVRLCVGVCVCFPCPQVTCNKVVHRLRFISGIISHDSSTGMF